MLIDWNELEATVEFVSMGNEAVLCRKTGKFLWHSDLEEDLDAWPDDAEDETKYLVVPDKKELDLGKTLLQRKQALDRWRAFENKATEDALKEWCKAHGLTIREDKPEL